MRGKPAGSPITWPRFRWYGPGEPGEGDLVTTVAGHAAYVVEEARRTGDCIDSDGLGYKRYRLELTKLDPDEIEEFDWTVRFD